MAREPNTFVPLGHQEGERAKGPTRSYHVTLRKADSYIDILRKSRPDLKFRTNGGDNESGVSFAQPNLFNGDQWTYDKISQGPFTQNWQKGTVKLQGRDNAHFHIGGKVADASEDDVRALHSRIMHDGDDNTMAITDDYGNIAIFGRPAALLRRGFSEQDFMEHKYEGILQYNLPGYKGSQIMKVLVPGR
jgi:hypothetical protein